MFKPHHVFALVLTLTFVTASSFAGILQVQNGSTVGPGAYSGTETAWIHSGVPNNIVGGNSILRAGFQLGGTASEESYRTLVRFGQISPFAGVTPASLGFASTDITGATITLYRKGGVGSGTVEMSILDTVDQDWTETFTTWNQKRTDLTSPDDEWSQGPGIGGAFGSIIGSAQAFSDSDAAGTATVFDLTANAAAMQLVKDWFSGTDTSGSLLVRATAETGTGENYIDWNSENSGVAGTLKPLLTVTYAIPEPASMTLLTVGSCLILLRRRK